MSDFVGGDFDAMNNEIVAKRGSLEWTRGELDTLFGRVSNPENWKFNIDAIATFDNDRDLLGTAEAIIFYTGSVATITATGDTRNGKALYRVKAAGYYLTIGA